MCFQFSDIPVPVPVSAHPQEPDGEPLYDVVSTLGHGTNSNNVRFKIYYTSPGKSAQQKIFKAPSDISLPYLKEKLQSTFNLESFNNCQLSWNDEDGDFISVQSNEDLIIALDSMKYSVVRFNLQSLDPVSEQTASSIDKPKETQDNVLSLKGKEVILSVPHNPISEQFVYSNIPNLVNEEFLSSINRLKEDPTNDMPMQEKESCFIDPVNDQSESSHDAQREDQNIQLSMQGTHQMTDD